MEKEDGAGDSLFAFTEYRKWWWGKRALVLNMALLVFAAFCDGGFFSEFPSQSESKLANIKDLKFRPDQKTSGWRATEQLPQLICMGKYCPVIPNEVHCDNAGVDKGELKWDCKASMTGFSRFIYGLDESTVVCARGRYSENVVDGSCYLIYSLQNIAKRNSITVAFDVLILWLCLWVPSTSLNLPPSQENRGKSIPEKSTSSQLSQPPSTPLPVCSEDPSSTDEAGPTEKDPWSDLKSEQQRSERSLMYWRGFADAFITLFFVTVAIELTIRVQVVLTPKWTKTIIIS